MIRYLTLLALTPFVVHAAQSDNFTTRTTSVPEFAAADPAEALIREAALHSPLMLEQELRIAQADAFRFRGWRQYMPYITANYQAGYFTLISAADPNAKEGSGYFGGTASLSAYYPLFQWGAIAAEKQFAFARENMAREEAVIAWRALVKDIRERLLEAVVAKAKIALLDRRTTNARNQQVRTEQELKLGRIVEAEKTARLLTLRNLELDLSRKKIELASILSKLRGLSGSEKLGVEDIPSDLPDINWDEPLLRARLADYEKVGLEDSPEHRLARHASEFYDNQRVIAESRELPSFNLGATVNQTPIEKPGGFGLQTYAFAGVMGTWNIFDRATTQENVRSLRIAQRLVDAKLAFGTLQKKSELRSSLEQLASARQAIDLRRDIVKLRTEVFNATKERLRLGLAKAEEVADAEDALLASKLDLTTDRALVIGAYHAFMSGILLAPTDQYYTAPTNEN